MKTEATRDSESVRPAELRRRAEERLLTKDAQAVDVTPGANARALVHELQVHQIELEMQNEELRRARQEAEEASEKYSDLFDFAPTGHYLWDRKGRILEINLAGAALLGLERSAASQKRFGQFVAAEFRGAFAEFLVRVLASDAKQTCEVIMERDGASVWVLVEGIAAQGRQVAERLCRATVIDISAQKRADQLAAANRAIEAEMAVRKRAEEALQQSGERYRAVASIVTDIVWRTDPAGDYVEPQDSWERYTGQTWEQHRGSGWVNAVHPEDRERVAAIWRRACETRSPYESRGRLWHGPTQSWRYYVGRAVPLLNPDGTVREWVGCDADVHEQKMAEEALRASEEKFSILFSKAAIPAALSSLPEGVFVDVNDAWTQMTGYTKAEVMGKTAAELGIVDDAELRTGVIEQLRKHEPVINVERTLYPKSGVPITVLANSGCIEVSGKDYALSSVYDITDRKKAQEVLARDKEELEKLVAERTERLQELVGELEHFSYSITHDMRAPLRAMRGFAEVMGGCVHEQQREYLGRITTAAERMDGLITDALSYSKAIRQELPLAPVDVPRLLRGMLDTYPELQSARADIRAPREMPLVMGNEAGLTQCFSNLLGNAVKFVKPGLRPEVAVRSETHDGWVRIWVEDNGIGISREMLPRVFDMFSRGASPQAGTGIGLALVRKVVSRMGGKVGVESEVGRGSRFWVELRPGDVRLAPASGFGGSAGANAER